MTNARRKLTNSMCQEIYHALLQCSVNGKLMNGTIRHLAVAFSVCSRTISRIWRRARVQLTEGEEVDVSRRMSQVVGRKRIHIEMARVAELPLRRRRNIRSIATELGVSKTTLHRRIKEGALRAHTNAIKPALTDSNKNTRLEFCFSFLTRSKPTSNPIFLDMFNIIHIDEKWFYLTRTTKRYYLLPCEEEPYRTCKSKRFITKVMFLATVARPRLDAERRETFSGKIGIFPLTTQEPARRSSKNRAAGTLETKVIMSVTKEVTRTLLIEKVLPAIVSQWPQPHSGPIWIQQDNAPPHIDANDEMFVAAANRTGLDIRLCFKPPNSPDLNVLDLGFFRAIQSLQEQQPVGGIDELVSAVQGSFESMPSSDLDKVFLTLQTCMTEIMRVRGGNNYRIPHLGKDSLNRQGNLPLQLGCDADLIEEVVAHLDMQQD